MTKGVLLTRVRIRQTGWDKKKRGREGGGEDKTMWENVRQRNVDVKRVRCDNVLK